MRAVGMLLLAAAVASLGTAHAEGLLGRNYVGASFGAVQFGDDEADSILDLGYEAGLGANVNLAKHFDLGVYADYLWANGDCENIETDYEVTSGGANLVYILKPGEKANPYISAGLFVTKAEADETDLGGAPEGEQAGPDGQGGRQAELEEQVEDSSGFPGGDGEDGEPSEDSEVGVRAGVGVELDCSESVLANFGLNYQYVDDEDAVGVSAGLGYWFSPRVVGRLAGAYDTDSGDAGASVGLVFTL